MTRRRRLGVACIAFGVSALALVLGASPVHAEAPSKTGWWFELQSKSLPAPLPSPPVVPDGGLYVQQGPQGPTAYGAVHYDASNASSATLTLTTAPGSTASLGAPAQACATSAPWTAPNPSPGAWEDAPKYGAPCTPGKIAADGSAVAFFFNSVFFRNGQLDLAIVPIDGAAPYSLVFNKPSTDSLQLTTKPPALPTSTPTTVAMPSAAIATKSEATASTGVTGAKPSTPAGPPAQTPAPAESSRPAVANTALNLVGFGDPDRGARMAALSGASAIVLGWWLLSTRAVRMPQLLGAMAGAGGSEVVASDPTRRVAGVGRFARTRTGPARRLR